MRIPPGTYTSLQVNCCIANSGVIHGPPLDDQPGQLCIVNSRPKRSASFIACFFNSSHSSLKYSIGPFGIPVPASKLKTPPMPIRCIASRSRVIPCFEILPFIQNQKTCGFAEDGGSMKSSSRVEEFSVKGICEKFSGMNEKKAPAVIPVL